MLLYLYIGTTAYVWIEEFVHQKYLDTRLKNEGYIVDKNKKSDTTDHVYNRFKYMLLFLPLLNLLSPLSHFNKEKSYNDYKNDLLRRGVINKSRETKKQDEIKIDDATLVQRQNKEGHTYYSSKYMSNHDNIEEDIDENYQKEIGRRH